MGNVGEDCFYQEIMSDATPGKVWRFYEWKTQVPLEWKTDRTLLDGVIYEVRIPVYDASQGEQVRAKRKALGLGLREAAERLKLRPSRLSELERGEIIPTGSSSLEKILLWLELQG